jgi:Envelope integrity protein A
MRSVAVTMMACVLFSGATFADDSMQSSSPDATLELSGGSLAAGIGVVWGHGDVVYQGERHRISLSGLSIVDVGVASITASGVVYNLKHLEDLNGNYVAATAGLTIAGGGSADYLENEHGVVIKILSTTRGLRFNLSADGMKVQLQS